LGYTASEARRAAGAVAGGDDGLDLRIKAALQELARAR
jgi:RuvA, C-terminal domain